MKPTLKIFIIIGAALIFIVEPLWDLAYHVNVLRGLWIWFIDLVALHAVRAAVAAIVVLYACYVAISGLWNPLRLALGEDGRLSTSKFQFLLWTAPVLFVFLALAFGRKDAALANLPSNVLIVLGFSLTTLVGAKGITVSYSQANRINKDRVPDDLSLRYLIQSDSGRLDLTKAQMLAWTAIAIGTFLYSFLAHYADYVACTGGSDTKQCFPDIDTALMVLMGLGQGTYLGGKLVAIEPSIVDAITAIVKDKAVTITLTGSNLTGGSLTVNGITPESVDWKGTTATTVVPTTLGADTLAAGSKVTIAGRLGNVALTPTTIQIAAPPS